MPSLMDPDGATEEVSVMIKETKIPAQFSPSRYHGSTALNKWEKCPCCSRLFILAGGVTVPCAISSDGDEFEDSTVYRNINICSMACYLWGSDQAGSA